MKAVTITYDPITGAQMTEAELYPTDTQAQKVRKALHEASKRKKEIITKRSHTIQHKSK